jgi:hypothetical protein
VGLVLTKLAAWTGVDFVLGANTKEDAGKAEDEKTLSNFTLHARDGLDDRVRLSAAGETLNNSNLDGMR